jgi:hypothetical protein
VRVTARVIEIFHRGARVGVHQRRYLGPRHGTDADHMPASHRHYADWTPDRFRRWAGKFGPNTEGLIAAVLADPARAEAVSARAIEIGALASKAVASLLGGRRGKPAAKDGGQKTLFDHANLRGPGYYH